jgi:dTDP-4-dehydrorhamnose 3,5-epimerase
VGCDLDVALDLRVESPTFRQWLGVELSGENRLALYIPEGCAHGLLALADDCKVLYQMTQLHAPCNLDFDGSAA